MADDLVSVDEYLSHHKDFVKDGDILVKGGNRPIPSWDAEKRRAKFVLSSQNPDRDNDIVVQEGLDLTRFMENPQALLFHNSRDWPIGSWSDLEKHLNGRPRRTEGWLNVLPGGGPIPEVDQAAWMLEHGGIKTVSIGFIPKTIRRREVPDEFKNDPYYWAGYEILSAELIECSLVPIPAQPDAIAKMAKGDLRIAKELLEEVLDNWVKHPETKILMKRADYEASLKQATGDRSTVVVTNLPETAPKAQDEGDALNLPETPDLQSQSIFRRALSFMFGKDNQARVDAAIQAALAEAEAETKAEAARVAALEEERKQLKERASAIRTRLASKGLIESSANAETSAPA